MQTRWTVIVQHNRRISGCPPAWLPPPCTSTTCCLTFHRLVVALGEELHGLGGAQRRAQQPLAVRVLAELAEDAAVSGLDRRQAGLVLRLLAGRVVVALQRGLLGVDDEAGEGAAALELFHGVVDHPVHGCGVAGGGGGDSGGVDSGGGCGSGGGSAGGSGGGSEASAALLIFLPLSSAVFKAPQPRASPGLCVKVGLIFHGERERERERERPPPPPPPLLSPPKPDVTLTNFLHHITRQQCHPPSPSISSDAAASILSSSAPSHAQLASSCS